MKTNTPNLSKNSKNDKEKSKRNYTYTELNKLEPGKIVNVYGVIIDATFPHKSMKLNSDKYICTYKIVDPSC